MFGQMSAVPLGDSRQQMQAKASGDAVGRLIIPDIPFSPLPKRVAKAYPELDEWHKAQNEAMKQWREKLNAVLVGVQTSTP